MMNYIGLYITKSFVVLSQSKRLENVNIVLYNYMNLIELNKKKKK